MVGRGRKRAELFDADCDDGPSTHGRRNAESANGQPVVCFRFYFHSKSTSNGFEATIACRRPHQVTTEAILACARGLSREDDREPKSGRLARHTGAQAAVRRCDRARRLLDKPRTPLVYADEYAEGEVDLRTSKKVPSSVLSCRPLPSNP